MSRRSGGLFAGRGIALPGIWITLATVAVAFAIGLGVGWMSGYVPDLYRSWQAGPEPSPSATPSSSPSVAVSVPELAPITRELDEKDAEAGVLTTDVPVRAAGTLSIVPGTTPETDDGGPVRYVRIEVEDGLTVDADAFASFVMSTLNSPQGWGSAGRMQFVQTEGVADVRVVLASPYEVVARCPDPHMPATLDLSSTSPSPDAESAAVVPCAVQGVVPISMYDWTLSLPSFGGASDGGRAYLINHFVGHVLGEEDVTCESGRAPVMSDQTEIPEGCTKNAWPYRGASG